MTTTLRVILAAMGIAGMASPVMAQSPLTRPYVEEQADYIANAPRFVSPTHRAHKPVGHQGGHNPL
jgi:hypothetical protein